MQGTTWWTSRSSVGLGGFYVPSDADSLILAAADVVVKAQSGRGVAREVAERVLAEGGVNLEEAYESLIAGWSAAEAAQ